MKPETYIVPCTDKLRKVNATSEAEALLLVEKELDAECERTETLVLALAAVKAQGV